MYRKTSYIAIFEQLKSNSCKFKAYLDDYFLVSLSLDGYYEWEKLSSDRKIESLSNEDKIGLTSIANTGFIYYEDGDCYYNISIHYVNDKTNEYEVTVTYCPMMFIQDDSGEIQRVIM